MNAVLPQRKRGGKLRGVKGLLKQNPKIRHVVIAQPVKGIRTAFAFLFQGGVVIFQLYGGSRGVDRDHLPAAFHFYLIIHALVAHGVGGRSDSDGMQRGIRRNANVHAGGQLSFRGKQDVMNDQHIRFIVFGPQAYRDRLNLGCSLSPGGGRKPQQRSQNQNQETLTHIENLHSEDAFILPCAADCKTKRERGQRLLPFPLPTRKN